MAKIIHKTTKRARSAATPRRRVTRKTEMAKEHDMEAGHETSGMTRDLSRRALVPLKELYFVGIGAVDWMMEQAMTIEKNLSERGHRRNETLSRMASQMGGIVGDKTKEMSKRGRERMHDMSEKFGEGLHKVRMRDEMSEAEPA
ncbi:hypothetical protein ACXR0O_06825 [Verrucomicrobiota bacterium sgz303538]